MTDHIRDRIQHLDAGWTEIRGEPWVAISEANMDALLQAAELLSSTEDIHFRPEVREALDVLGIEHKG